MIKDLIKRILQLAALIIIVVYTVSSLLNGFQRESFLILELVAIAALLSIGQLLLGRFKSNYYIIEVLAEFLMAFVTVSGAGLIFGWFYWQKLWMVLLYVTPVYVAGYFLGMMRTKRDVDFINEKIKERMERGVKNEQRDDNR